MKVVVTGGAGFIGSHLVDRLYDDGYDVIVVDNMHTGSWKNIKHAEYDYYPSVNKFILEEKIVDAIFHLGMPSSSPMYKENPMMVADVIWDAQLLLNYARRIRDVRIIVASTSSLYNGNQTPYWEGAEIHVTDFYTEARYYVERLCKLYSKLYSVESICLRLFSVYGEREEYKGKYANLVSQFTWNFIRNEPPVIYGDGNQTRDFIYVGDVVEAFLKAMDFDFSSRLTNFEVFNVGTGKETSLNELVSMLQKLFKKDLPPVYTKNTIPNYVYRTLADTRSAEAFLKFKAKTTLDEGLKIVKKYYEELFRESYGR